MDEVWHFGFVFGMRHAVWARRFTDSCWATGKWVTAANNAIEEMNRLEAFKRGEAKAAEPSAPSAAAPVEAPPPPPPGPDVLLFWRSL